MHAKFDVSTAGSLGGVKADTQNCALYISLSFAFRCTFFTNSRIYSNVKHMLLTPALSITCV